MATAARQQSASSARTPASERYRPILPRHCLCLIAHLCIPDLCAPAALLLCSEIAQAKDVIDHATLGHQIHVVCFLQFQVRLDHLVRTASGPHPKLAALLDIVREHFQQHGASGEAEEASRVIIFTGLRETVHSICEALLEHEPLIQAK